MSLISILIALVVVGLVMRAMLELTTPVAFGITLLLVLLWVLKSIGMDLRI